MEMDAALAFFSGSISIPKSRPLCAIGKFTDSKDEIGNSLDLQWKTEPVFCRAIGTTLGGVD